MSEMSSQVPDEAMLDLLIKQITEGLSSDEQRALDVMDGDVASAHLRGLERAAAAVSLAASSGGEPPPAALAQRVASDAQRYFAARPIDLAAARRSAAAAAEAEAPRRAPRSGGAYGWLAAAGFLVAALFGWLRPTPLAPIAQVTPPSIVAPPVVVSPALPPALPVPPTPTELRAALMAAPDSLKITLGATKDKAAAGVTGDVVWDPVTQKGYLHFVGLTPNDPARHQYQLWIFDGGRDKRYPVDGGVFDIPADATEAVIPIHAALAVLKPAAFAVTIEKPGGVVVSGREHVVVLGAAS